MNKLEFLSQLTTAVQEEKQQQATIILLRFISSLDDGLRDNMRKAIREIYQNDSILTADVPVSQSDMTALLQWTSSNGHKPAKGFVRQLADRVSKEVEEEMDSKALLDEATGVTRLEGTIKPIADEKLIDRVRRYLQTVPKMSVVTMRNIMDATGLTETQVPPIVATLRANKILRRKRGESGRYQRATYIRMAGADAIIARLLRK